MTGQSAEQGKKKSAPQMNKPFRLTDVMALRQTDGDRTNIKNGSAYRGPPALPLRFSRSLRLGLNTLKVICVLAVAAVLLRFAYDYAQENSMLKEAMYQRVKSLHPLYYGGEPMAREWARKALKDIEYAKRWYECIGEGEVTVLLWTVWLFA